MKLNSRIVELQLANPWKIAGSQGSAVHKTVIVELNADGIAAKTS